MLVSSDVFLEEQLPDGTALANASYKLNILGVPQKTLDSTVYTQLTLDADDYEEDTASKHKASLLFVNRNKFVPDEVRNMAPIVFVTELDFRTKRNFIHGIKEEVQQYIRALSVDNYLVLCGFIRKRTSSVGFYGVHAILGTYESTVDTSEICGGALLLRAFIVRHMYLLGNEYVNNFGNKFSSVKNHLYYNLYSILQRIDTNMLEYDLQSNLLQGEEVANAG